INVESAVTLSSARQASSDLTTAIVPAGTSFPAVSREPCDLLGREAAIFDCTGPRIDPAKGRIGRGFWWHDRQRGRQQHRIRPGARGPKTSGGRGGLEAM